MSEVGAEQTQLRAAEQAADIAETVLSGCVMTVVMVALFVLVLWWLWR